MRWADVGGDPLDLIFGIAWSPDDRTVLVDKSDLYIKDRRLLLVDPASGKSSVLLRESDAKNVTDEWWSDWAPDGKGIYYISDRDNDYHVYYKALSEGDPEADNYGRLGGLCCDDFARGQRNFYRVECEQAGREAAFQGAPGGRSAARRYAVAGHAYSNGLA